MKTYYGQMTKEQLKNTKIRIESPEHSESFQKMCFESGFCWKMSGKSVSSVNSSFLYVHDKYIYAGVTSRVFEDHGFKEICWHPDQEKPEEPSDLKTQLSEAIAKRDKRKAKLQKSADKLEQAEKEVQRLIAELENDVESIGGVSCKIAEMTKPDIPEGVDVDDPRTWQAGDVVDCVESVAPHVTQGSEYIFDNYDRHHFVTIKHDDEWDQADFDLDSARFRFVRRP